MFVRRSSGGEHLISQSAISHQWVTHISCKRGGHPSYPGRGCAASRRRIGHTLPSIVPLPVTKPSSQNILSLNSMTRDCRIVCFLWSLTALDLPCRKRLCSNSLSAHASKTVSCLRQLTRHHLSLTKKMGSRITHGSNAHEADLSVGDKSERCCQ
jgi:hypothetical protein